MKEKIKIDRYIVHEKGKDYEILLFPFIKNMWAFDDHPEENCLMVDGCKEAFHWLKYAFAILANYKDKIIYFPCKQEMKCYYKTNYNLVLCRSELQFRRSRWFKIKDKLDKKHYAGKFILNYDRKKLDDYYTGGFDNKYSMEDWHENGLHFQYHIINQLYENRIEDILGDTIFFVLDRREYYDWHYHTARDLDDYSSGLNCQCWSSIGWIISDANIKKIQLEEQEYRKKKLQEEKNLILPISNYSKLPIKEG